MKRHVCPILIIFLLGYFTTGQTTTWAGSDEAEIKVSKAGTEQFERDVDEVALSAQEKAISRLQGLLKKYKGTSQEPVFLSKLADFQQQSASIIFRIAHGNAKALDLTRFKRAVNQSITTFSTLIAKYPHYEEIPHAYFARGKGYEDLEDKAKATSDYLHLVKNYPNADEAPSAYMALAEFAIQANDHKTAISYLEQVEKKPESPHYPFALYKLAWSHYNLKAIGKALSYAEKQIDFYAGSKEDGTATSDNALRENTLLDIPVFYFEGYEEKISQYQLDYALSYFHKVADGEAATQAILGKMFVRFSKLLRSHGYEADLVSWKNQILAKESNRPESLEVALVTYENQQNKRRFQQLVETTGDIVKLYKSGKRFEGFARAQKMILDTAEGLQTMVIKNKDANEVGTYSKMLASIYEAFTQIVEEKDPRIPRVHYNLAETLFAIKDFNGATDHYRWIVDHGDWKKSSSKATAKNKAGETEQASVQDSSLKAIASRYEVLRQKQQIPGELKATPISKHKDDKLDPLLAQWVDWIETHAKHSSEGIDNFLFESFRARYAQGHITDTLEKMRDFVHNFVKSSYAIPSATLMLDTYIASEDWIRTYDLAKDFMKVSEWKNGDFSKRLFAVAADASFKKVELLYKAKDYAKALEGADEFLKAYGDSARIADMLTLAGSAALASQDKVRASSYFTQMIQAASTPGKKIDPAALGAALVGRAKLEEEEYQFGRAAADYRAFLAITDQKKTNDLRVKVLALTWLSNDMHELAATLKVQKEGEKGPGGVCTDAISTECQKYGALLAFASAESSQDKDTVDRAFERAHEGRDNDSKEIRAIWAAVALEGSKHLAFRDRNHMIKRLGSGWGDLDPMVRFAILPRIVKSVPKAFQLNRTAMKDVAPLKADERYITHRVDSIREMENAATAALKLPWARIRAEVSNEIAGLYIDLAHGLSDLKSPKGLSDAETASYQDTIRKLVMPFEEKGQDLRSKAFEIASTFAIEEDSFQRIAEPFFVENPSQAKKLRTPAAVATPATGAPPAGEAPALGLSFLAKIEPNGGWLSLPKAEATGNSRKPASQIPFEKIKAHWAEALQAKLWPQIAFFMQEAQEKNIASKGVMGVIRAISLAAVGARGEALTEIDEARKQLQPEEWMFVTSSLMQIYSKSFAQAKSQSFGKEIQKAQEEALKKAAEKSRGGKS